MTVPHEDVTTHERARFNVSAARLVFAVAVIVVGSLLASRARYIPMWDGRIYADCIVQAATGPFSLEALRCAGHVSQLYIGFMVAVQGLAPTSYIPMLFANTVLLGLATLGFARILRIAFPGEELRTDRALLTAALAVQPSILASVVQPGLDFPLVPALLWCIAFLLERRTIPAIAMGVIMAFTKETGVLLYAVLVACYGLWVIASMRSSLGTRLIALGRMTPLAVPVLIFGFYLLIRARTMPAGAPVIWNANPTGDGILGQFIVPRLDAYLVNYLVIALFMNFAWVATVFIGVDAYVGTARAARRLPRRPLAGAKPEVVVFLAVLTLAVLYALTRFSTFGNSRYLVTAMALVLFPFLASLVRLGMPPRARHIVLAVFAVAYAVSSVRTVDPVSRLMYGTFPVGSNDMLHMTRIARECCGRGRDQLAYNLEFTNLDALTQRALETLPRVDSATLVVPDWSGWFTIGPLDRRTRRRTLASTDTLMPPVVEMHEVLGAKTRPPHIYYFALPYASAARGLRLLEKLYTRGEMTRFERGGYEIPVYSLTLRGAVSTDSTAKPESGSTR